MTIEERDTARAIQAIAKHIDGQRINWEQRRYEIAREIMAETLHTNPQIAAREAVQLANVLIKELKNNPMK